MRNEYDFSKGKRGAIIPSNEKNRITLYIDDAILESLREQAEASGVGYQTLINEILKAHLEATKQHPLTESALRRILREEISKSAIASDIGD
ncbi:MAG: BrnA antitoxin family protein [Cyanobacteria bacterium P01_C01_bin.121]